jgi:hypothetical protein
METFGAEDPHVCVTLVIGEDNNNVRELARLRRASFGGETSGKAGGQRKKCERRGFA